MMNWDYGRSDSKGLSLDCHAKNAKESSPKNAKDFGGGGAVSRS